jgi:hypothetical protein
MKNIPGRILGLCLLLLLALEVMRVFWIMPFPGSQRGGTLDAAHALHQWIWPLRLLVGIPALWLLWRVLRDGSMKARSFAVIAAALVGFVAWQANGPQSADVMFRQPTTLTFDAADATALPSETLVIGVALKDAAGETHARAYPVRFLGYHHQVRDELAGQPLMATYCTVCRSGRVFSPLIDGQLAQFRLVGMDLFNAMFEDDRSGSWWRQANGEAVVGPRRGERLQEIPSQQMTLAAWRVAHPDSQVMAPDPTFAAAYDSLKGYEDGTRPGQLTGRNPDSWQDKSWVVGVLAGDAAHAFDWNDLVRERVLARRVGEVPVLLVLAEDGQTFRAFDARLPDGTILDLQKSGIPDEFIEPATDARWHESGRALDGAIANTILATLPAYQEFWHSWRTFQPQTTR